MVGRVCVRVEEVGCVVVARVVRVCVCVHMYVCEVCLCMRVCVTRAFEAKCPFSLGGGTSLGTN